MITEETLLTFINTVHAETGAPDNILEIKFSRETYFSIFHQIMGKNRYLSDLPPQKYNEFNYDGVKIVGESLLPNPNKNEAR